MLCATSKSANRWPPTRRPLLVLRGFAHLHPDTNGFNPRVRFSPDGQRIAAVCHDIAHPVSIWSPEAGWQRPRARSPRQPHHLRLGRPSAVDGTAVAACATGILVPGDTPRGVKSGKH